MITSICAIINALVVGLLVFVICRDIKEMRDEQKEMRAELKRDSLRTKAVYLHLLSWIKTMYISQDKYEDAIEIAGLIDQVLNEQTTPAK